MSGLSSAHVEGEGSAGGMFQCKFCGLEERYHYHGKRPPFAKGFVFLEEGFVAKDPFAPNKQGLFLFLGGTCSVCQATVCQDQECSFFYTKRFCISCAKKNCQEFPAEIQKLLH